MNNLISLILNALGGFILGAFFYFGLYWTVKKGLTSNHPGPLFAFSFFLRTAVVVAGVLLITRGIISALIPCAFGILLSRITVHFIGKKIPIPNHMNT